MVTKLILEQWSDWLEPGSSDDSRLLHSDTSDKPNGMASLRIFVCPPNFGRGYYQEIILQDDFTLIINDYTLERDLVIDAPSQNSLLEFDFRLGGTDAGYSFFVPYFGLKDLGIERSHQRNFKIEICFKKPALLTYFHEFMANLPSEIQAIAEKVIQSIYRYQSDRSTSNAEAMLDRILQDRISPIDLTFEQILPQEVHSQVPTLNCAARNLTSPAMQEVIGEILSCPYQGKTRRTYLKQKALQLIALYLKVMLRKRSDILDRHCIYQAEAILKDQSVNPPSIETLARQIGTNRFKLNRGFQQIYGTTPYEYVKHCRLWQAKRLLMTSELSIEEIAAIVGYKSRSRFATAFRQHCGINPKAFQMQTWQCAS